MKLFLITLSFLLPNTFCKAQEEPREIDQELSLVLEQAVEKNADIKFKEAEELLKKGADVNREIWPKKKDYFDRVTETQLQRAHACNPHALPWLLDHGANVNKITKFRTTPFLHLCVTNNGDKLYKHLLVKAIKAGANLNAQSGLYDMTALHLAVFHGFPDAVQVLLAPSELQKKLAAIKTFNQKNTYFYLLPYDLIEYLINFGKINTRLKNSSGQTPLEYAQTQLSISKSMFGEMIVEGYGKVERESHANLRIIIAKIQLYELVHGWQSVKYKAEVKSESL